VSLAGIRSGLRKILRPTGKDASIKEILELHGYSFRVTTPAAGQLSIVWTTKIGHKQVTVAHGNLIFAGAYTTKFTISLTSQGRAALARYSALAVRANASFLTSGLGQVKESGGFTLARYDIPITGLAAAGAASRRTARFELG
jgi:hypothetical protein